MTSSLGLLALFADVVILLALGAAVASRGASQLARAVIATFAFAWAWLLTAVFDALRAPGWTMFTGGAVIVVSIVVIIVTVHLWTQGGDGGESDPRHRGNDGGGPQRGRPDAPQHGGGGNDPSWWPEFERQVAFYVAQREREKQQPAVLPAESAAWPDGRGGYNFSGTGRGRSVHLTEELLAEPGGCTPQVSASARSRRSGQAGLLDGLGGCVVVSERNRA